MLIKSIRLENIRSYKSQQINFSEGTTLLAGDIGAGKSSILLGIEFALFGIRRPYLTGSTLLRHGKNEGAVELCIQLDSSDIIIKRRLKRSGEDVSQDEGFISVNGSRKICSPIELRAEIFSLLGYPKELIPKNKDLVYRYTVYTPQEQMKEILDEDSETRLDILRKIFNIDKYKRIKENCSILIRVLKERKKYIELMCADLEEQKSDKKQKEELLKKTQSEIFALNGVIKKLDDEIQKAKSAKADAEARIKSLDKIKSEIRITHAKISSSNDSLKRNIDAITRAKSQIESAEKSIDNALVAGSEKLLDEIMKKESMIDSSEANILQLTSNISRLSAKIANIQEVIRKINSMDSCPQCFQKVQHEHKERFSSDEKTKADALAKQAEIQITELNNAKESIQKAKQDLALLKSKSEQSRLMKQKLETISERKSELEKLETENRRISDDILALDAINKKLSEDMVKFKDIEAEYRLIQHNLDELIARERNASIKKARHESEKANFQESIQRFEKEISEKELMKGKLSFISELQLWVDEMFLNLMDIIEKHIMFSIQHEFNGLFQKWFSALIDDETISVRIDDGFTPVIEQNGYETAVGNLSGGEKTAVALAYRLALNKVINDIISGINTKDILILDEPTDGFSSEQLDKVREVLRQIGIKQVIIVSHEPKIESFVDNIIRIGKDGHESSLV